MRSRTDVLAAIFGLAAVASLAHAAPVTFIYTGFASGTLAGDAFDKQAFTITGTADTDDVFATGAGWRVTHTSASIDFNSLGVLSVLQETSTAVNNLSGIVVFGNVPPNLALYILGSDPAFNTWDLLSSIGPFNLASSILQWNLGPLSTSGGELILNSQTGVGTFEAIVIPAPASVGLFGLAGLAAARRRR